MMLRARGGAAVAAVAVAASLAMAQGGRGRGPGMSAEARQATQLDLAGQGEQARALWQMEIAAAATPAAKAAAERNLAMSWAFSGNCAKTVEYENRVIAYWQTREAAEPANAFYQQGEMADEAARVCIDLGDLDAAAEMYQKGHSLGLKEPNLPAGRKDLWEYRYEHALARLAARRGQHAEAERHVAAARKNLDQMQADDAQLYQQQIGFFPYLTGYVAYYDGDYQTAIADFQKDTRHDPFITAMIGMTYEKQGDKAQAIAAYTEAAKASGHNPPAAFARPFARKKLAELGAAR
ncbi:MAG: hypothetical protein ACRD1L_03055 [Terriglobales bacterium]